MKSNKRDCFGIAALGQANTGVAKIPSGFQVLFDLGQCAAYMQLAAWELGIGSCPASIYYPEKAREILGFPAELHIRFALSFGYPLQEETIAAPPKKGGRKQLDDLVHWDRW